MPTEATDEGVIAPSVKVIAGVVVGFATEPETPLAVTTESVVTVPVLAVAPSATLIRVRTCAAVKASGVAAEPVLLPIIELAARFAIRASVICPASTEAERATAAEPLNPIAAAVIPPPLIEKLREVVRVAAEPVVF